MADTPRTERSQTRLNTPLSELYDHRKQPESLPRSDTMNSPVLSPGTRRGTFASINNELDLPVSQYMNEAFVQDTTTSRDFENAISDERSLCESPRERRESNVSPSIARRNTFRRPRDGHSFSSTVKSRSASPPNSVNAFADPRRRERAGTVTSQTRSDMDLALQTTISGGTHRVRQTFNDNRSVDNVKDNSSCRSSVKEDVCFPPDDCSGKKPAIDYEDLEEFVAAQVAKLSLDTANKPKVFTDLRVGMKHGIIEDGAYNSNDDKAVNVDDNFSPAELAEIRTIQTQIPLNKWTFFSSEYENTIHAPYLGDLLMPGETFRDLFELGPGGGVYWLDVLNPTEDEVFVLCKAFGVHPLTREDIFTQEPREKVELFKTYYFVCFRSFDQMDKESENYLDPVNVYAVVFREGLLTFTFTQNPHAASVRKRISRLRDYLALSADWICYALIDDIVDSFSPVIRDVEHQTESIEDQVFTARAEDSRTILRAIGDCRKKNMCLLRLLGGKADIIKGFAKRCNDQYSVAPRGDVGLYLSDIQDHVVTMMNNLAHFEKILSRSHSNYLAQISVDNLSQGNAVNETLGKVTLIATFLVPLNLVCGLFGMNVPVPGGNAPDGDLSWFFGILGIIFAFVIICLLLAKKLKYF